MEVEPHQMVQSEKMPLKKKQSRKNESFDHLTMKKMTMKCQPKQVLEIHRAADAFERQKIKKKFIRSKNKSRILYIFLTRINIHVILIKMY